MTDIDSRLPDELVEIFDDLRLEFLAPVDEGVESAHLTAMSYALASQPTLLSPRSARRALVAAALGAAVIGGGIAAASGDLPGPFQNAVSRVLEPFGLDVPRSHADEPLDSDLAPDPGAPSAAEPSDGPQPTTIAPDPNTPNVSNDPDLPIASGADAPNQVDTRGETETPGNGVPNTPGQSGSAPGQQSDPGNSENAPGQTGELPGPRPGTQPTRNKPESPPGLVP